MKLTRPTLQKLIREELKAAAAGSTLSKLTGGKAAKGFEKLGALNKDVEELQSYWDAEGAALSQGPEIIPGEEVNWQLGKMDMHDTSLDDYMKFENRLNQTIKEEYKKLLYEDEARQERRGLEYDIEKDPPVDYTQPRGSSYEASYGAEAPPDYSGPAGVTGLGGWSLTPQAQKTATPQLLDYAMLKNLFLVAQNPYHTYYDEARSALSTFGAPDEWLGASDESFARMGIRPGITPPGLTQKDLDRFTEYYWGQQPDQPTVGPLRNRPDDPYAPRWMRRGVLEEHQNRIVQEELEAIIKEEYKKLLEEHAKDYIWGVKAPYDRTANQYELSVLKDNLIS